ncbi:Hypothetical_protein [Hexamita inflata]|uniref:Hypothetical_protein n=1 Tax=Hexamita inflata TaxID=28002 RepID=A0AA86NR53_9EUKA|nr:Hypothetical protein HINF_LOCUS10976 [Hexamita inflata]
MGSCMYVIPEQDQKQLHTVTLSNLALNKFKTSFYESFCVSTFQINGQINGQINLQSSSLQNQQIQILQSNIDNYVDDISHADVLYETTDRMDYNLSEEVIKQ